MLQLKSIPALIAIAFLLLQSTHCNSQEDRLFQLEYRNGTTITASFVNDQIQWTAVSDLGQMSEQQMPVSKIDSLTLTLEPASAQLSSILKLIADLDDDDFYVREGAEVKLQNFGKRFRSVMQKTDILKTSDGKYRLRRLLSQMRGSKSNDKVIDLDILTLKDGKRLAGDAGVGTFEFMFRGKKLTVKRSLISRISPANTLLTTCPDAREKVESTVVNNHAEFMKTPGLKLVDFDHKPDGEPLKQTDNDISFAFVDSGLLLGTEYPKGCVGISGSYEITSGDKPVGGKSICVYKSKISKNNRFNGVMEITFCKAGKKDVAHGVRDFGIFASRVNHSRDIIVQAWDSMGRLLAVCESNDEPCPFFGIHSNVPIAKIRILSNPWLLELRRINADKDKSVTRTSQRVDPDFAVDSLMFSKPVAIDSIKKTRHLFSRNGDLIPLNWAKILNEKKIELGSPGFQILSTDLAQTSAIVLKPAPKKLPRKLDADPQWMAMLRDGCVFRWNPGEPPHSMTLKQDLNREDIIAIWPARTQPRMPLQGDFGPGDHVLAYPGCRVVNAVVDFDDEKFSWTGGQVKTAILHDDHEFKVDARSNDIPDDVAPRKKNYSFDVSNLPDFEIPTIWFEAPTTVPKSNGMIRLENDETIVYGENTEFQLKSLGKNRVLFDFRGSDISIPLEKVVSIFPRHE